MVRKVVLEKKDVLIQLRKENNVSEEYLMAIMEEDDSMKCNAHTLWDKVKAVKADAGAEILQEQDFCTKNIC